jgi:hypothetical protein
MIMATTKTPTVLADSVTLTAGAGAESSASSVWDLADGYGGLLNIKITNGATGPTVAAQSQIYVSPDNSNWYKLGGALIAALGNAVITSWSIVVPIGAKYLKTLSGSNTDQNVTIRVTGTEVTAI